MGSWAVNLWRPHPVSVSRRIASPAVFQITRWHSCLCGAQVPCFTLAPNPAVELGSAPGSLHELQAPFPVKLGSPGSQEVGDSL